MRIACMPKAVLLVGLVAATLIAVALAAEWVMPRRVVPVDDRLLAALHRGTWALSTVVPGDNPDELQAFRPLFESKRVVALGEATHGTREFSLMKDRLLRFLVAEMGFSLFAMETSTASAEPINAYVLGGEGDPRALVRHFEYWPWQTEEVLAMIEWMRAYNADPARTHKVEFHGIDPVSGERDRIMAANVERVLAAHGEDSKMVVWAHNLHVSQLSDEWMGYHLKQRWGDAVYLLGFEFNQGEFTSRDLFRLKTDSVGPAPPDYYAYALARLDTPLRFLDFRTMSKDDDLRRWLAQPQKSHQIGSMFYVRRYREAWHTLDQSWLQAFDGLIFIEGSTPTRLLGGLRPF